MLATFVIALREGLEAALIVGIIAGFLRKEGRLDALRPMWAGVGLAVVLCVGVGVVLRAVDSQLPRRAQEGMAAIIALVAVAMVTYMVLWMSRHARDLKGSLQTHAGSALAAGSTWALVAMAFLAVLREGFETAVFLLASFQDAGDPAAAGAGALLGLAVALALGYGIYRGTFRIDLARFFRVTGVLLVLVAAGLVSAALHAGAEAGWVTAGQATALDLSGVLRPGSVVSSLVTGLLGIQPEPTLIEVVGYLVYAVPMLVLLLAPRTYASVPRFGVATAVVISAPVVFVVGILAGGGASSTASAADTTGARTVQVAVSDLGCEPADLSLPSGPTTFVVTGHGSKVTEFELVDGDRTVGEAENLTAGLTASFSLTLQPGTLQIRCPGGSRSATGTLTVTGERTTTAAVDPALAAGVTRYRRYLRREAAALLEGVRDMQARLEAGDLAGARRAYAAARVPYERIEPVAEAFGDLDPDIDARANDVPMSEWTGFHPIERQLWRRNTTAGTRTLAAGLVRDSERLATLVQDVELQPAQIGNGANELLSEVSKSKVTGEEERYSRLDLVDFDANVDGAEEAYAAIRPALEGTDRALADEIDLRFVTVRKALAPLRRGDGFISYDRLTRAQIRRLSNVIDALAEPLSQAPAKAAAG